MFKCTFSVEEHTHKKRGSLPPISRKCTTLPFHERKSSKKVGIKQSFNIADSKAASKTLWRSSTHLSKMKEVECNPNTPWVSALFLVKYAASFTYHHLSHKKITTCKMPVSLVDHSELSHWDNSAWNHSKRRSSVVLNTIYKLLSHVTTRPHDVLPLKLPELIPELITANFS